MELSGLQEETMKGSILKGKGQDKYSEFVDEESAK